MWATAGSARIPDDADHPEVDNVSLVPGPGATRFRIFRIGPDKPGDDAELAAMADRLPDILPGFAEALELDDPGMHTTDTVDYIVAISGKADLELDDGVRITVEPGDCVVQRGTRHAWRNGGPDDFVAAAIMLGAARD